MRQRLARAARTRDMLSDPVLDGAPRPEPTPYIATSALPAPEGDRQPWDWDVAVTLSHHTVYGTDSQSPAALVQCRIFRLAGGNCFTGEPEFSGPIGDWIIERLEGPSDDAGFSQRIRDRIAELEKEVEDHDKEKRTVVIAMLKLAGFAMLAGLFFGGLIVRYLL